MKTIKAVQIKDTHFEINVVSEKETEKAVCHRIYSGCANKLIWIPKSLIKMSDTICEIPQWFCIKNFNIY
jgi:hypothetical protein